MSANGKASFYNNVANIIKKFYPNTEETIDIEQFVRDTNVNDFDNTMKNNYKSYWKQQIQNSTKLSFYSTFKKDYILEEYLNNIKDANQRRLHAKFRISNHKLESDVRSLYYLERKDTVNTAINQQLKTS